MSRHCVSVLLLVCIAQACLAFVPSWSATFRSSRSQPPASTPAAATFSLSQPFGAICPVVGACGTCGAQIFYPVRGMTSLSAMSDGDEEEGGGDYDAREAADGSPAADEIRAVHDEIRGIERKIEDVEKETTQVVKKIDGVEAAIAGGSMYLGMTDPEVLWKEKEQLRRTEEQLRRKEEQLRELLLKKEDSRIERLRANKAPAAGEVVTNFAAALSRAVITNNTLELANGTAFIGHREMGSKLFIRSCYKDLWKIIIDGAINGSMGNIVVTGTPGIGKSVFGYYLLYLLRLEGKTVVFEQKDKWYRFSDVGVLQGRFETFSDAGCMDDPAIWYLSDPEGKPHEGFTGITVVLVSPGKDKTNEFLKQDTACRLFMPVWSEDELLECRRIIFPDARSVNDVRKAFIKVGGVARAVFRPRRFEHQLGKMKRATSHINLGLLRQVCAVEQIELLSTDETGDALFHLLPSPGTAYECFDVVFASDYALDLVEKAVSEREFQDFQGHVMATFENADLSRKVGGSARGQMFERLAHAALTRSVRLKKPSAFNMTILSKSGKNVSGGGELSLNFTRIKEFGGEAFPRTSLRKGTYYRPTSQTFPAVDSFFVDRSTGTLYFFQMKSAGVEVIETGASLEKFWRLLRKASPSRNVFLCI
ncbi:unnamed protein product [Ectocarpus sp. 4 AP-2014]